jgi:hypothetical protein
MLKASKNYDVPLWVTVETTIFHELGHAICELERDILDANYFKYSDEEEWVENLAYQLHYNFDILIDLKKLIREYKKYLKN